MVWYYMTDNHKDQWGEWEEQKQKELLLIWKRDLRETQHMRQESFPINTLIIDTNKWPWGSCTTVR